MKIVALDAVTAIHCKTVWVEREDAPGNDAEDWVPFEFHTLNAELLNDYYEVINVKAIVPHGTPWQLSLRNIAAMLEAEGYYLAGNPHMKRKRPKMLLAIPKAFVEHCGIEVLEVQ